MSIDTQQDMSVIANIPVSVGSVIVWLAACSRSVIWLTSAPVTIWLRETVISSLAATVRATLSVLRRCWPRKLGFWCCIHILWIVCVEIGTSSRDLTCSRWRSISAIITMYCIMRFPRIQRRRASLSWRRWWRKMRSVRKTKWMSKLLKWLMKSLRRPGSIGRCWGPQGRRGCGIDHLWRTRHTKGSKYTLLRRIPRKRQWFWLWLLRTLSAAIHLVRRSRARMTRRGRWPRRFGRERRVVSRA